MAEKGFGVKEINLIGASGTPTIESPNNLNLNAVNVAISTNVSIGGTLTVSGNISVGGTLTYEDVTNIDSVGIVTARAGLKVTGGTSFFAGAIAAAGAITGTASTATTITVASDTTDTLCFPIFTNTGVGNNGPKVNTTKLSFNSSTGALSATSFVGDGSSLTNLPAANLTGTLPAISGANLTGIAVTEAPVTDYTITANGSSAYRFHGGGVDETADNPDLYLVRGQKYRFNNTTGSSHPFAIREASGGSAYSNGVTGSQNGIQFFTVPYDAPAKIFYQCTVHGGMVGNIYIRGANGNNNNVGVTTFTGAVRQKGNPVFIAYRTQYYTLSSSATEMVYNNERIDVGSNYNTSNGRFTAPVTGLYEFAYASIAHNDNTVYRYALRINGSEPYSPMTLELRIHNASSEYGTNGEYVCYVNMTEGQYASVYAKVSSASAISCYGDSNYGYTYFRGRLIG